MITRTIKYTASDGTEHDSPQEAATHDLQNYLYRLIEQCWPGIPTKDLVEVTTGLARNPEALRDAVNAYFEDLEAHPDSPATQAFDDMVRTGLGVMRVDPAVFYKEPDNRICAICDGGPGNDGVCLCGEERWVEPDPKADHKLVLTEKAKELTPNLAYPTIKDWTDQGWTRDELLAQGMAVELEEGEIATGVCGFEMDLGTYRVRNTPRFERVVGASHEMPKDKDRYVKGTLPVDHPQYCRPFGTRED